MKLGGVSKPHPEFALMERLARIHNSLGCPRCKTALDAFGHLALLKTPPVQMFRQGRASAGYSGYVYGEKSRSSVRKNG